MAMRLGQSEWPVGSVTQTASPEALKHNKNSIFSDVSVVFDNKFSAENELGDRLGALLIVLQEVCSKGRIIGV